MAEDKQLTVAELLARARKDNPDAAEPKRRRRRSLEDGGISVAELTGSFPAVTEAPPEAKHTAVSLDGEEKPTLTPAKDEKPAEARKPDAEKPEAKKPEGKAPSPTPAAAGEKKPEAEAPAAKPSAAKSADAKKPEPKTPAAKPTETKKPTPAAKPTETKKPTPAAKPTDAEKPAEAKKPEPKTPAAKPTETKKPTPAAKPADAEKPAETKKPEPKTPAAKPAETKKPEPQPATGRPTAAQVPAAEAKKPAAADEDDAKTGVLKKVDAAEPKRAGAATPAATPTPGVEDTGVMPTVDDDAVGGPGSTALGVKSAERPHTDAEAEREPQGESDTSAVAVIGMAIVGIVLGAVIFFVFEMLWGALNPWLVGVLALLVTVGMVAAVRALRTARDGMTMTLAGLVGLVTTFGPALVVF